ncbi:hypothetical protein [Lacticaseibacillus brantae]|nr:hypothetical protein [Lacticaseibacillus brantae]
MKLTRGQSIGLITILLIGAVAFTSAAWFILKPASVIGKLSTVSFGISLMVGLIALAWYDGVVRTRMGRFCFDVIGGIILAYWVQFYIIGATPDLQYMVPAAGLVLLVSLIFSFRKSNAQRAKQLNQH